MRYILLTLALLMHVQLRAQQADSSAAASLYDQQDYAAAARIYEQEIAKSPTATSYHNLGVCYMAMDRLPDAILCYERALLLDPTLTETRHNLRLAYAQTIDGLSDGRTLELLDDLSYSLSSRALIILGCSLFALMLMLLIVFRLGGSIAVRKVAFYGAVVVLVLWLGCNAFIAHQWYYGGLARSRAIVTQPTVLFSSPEEHADKLLELNAGTALFVQETMGDGWYSARLADGRQGWISAGAIEPVVMPQQR